MTDYIVIIESTDTGDYQNLFPVDTDEEINEALAAMRAAGIQEAPIYRGDEDSIKTSWVLVAGQEVVNA